MLRGWFHLYDSYMIISHHHYSFWTLCNLPNCRIVLQVMSPLASATLFLLATSYLSTVLGNFHSDGFWFRQAETFLLHFVIFLLMFKAQSLEYWYFFVVVFGVWTATSVTQRWTLCIHQNWFLSFLYFIICFLLRFNSSQPQLAWD